jgi:hypothetical protein
MMKPRPRNFVTVAACVVTLVSAALLQPALAQTASSGAFRNLSAIETTLLRGVTTKAEVRRQLGVPNGSGAARFAHVGDDEREIWYYEDVAITGAKSADQVMKMDMRQQILLVLFKGEVVDGYLWTSNSGTGSVR